MNSTKKWCFTSDTSPGPDTLSSVLFPISANINHIRITPKIGIISIVQQKTIEAINKVAKRFENNHIRDLCNSKKKY